MLPVEFWAAAALAKSIIRRVARIRTRYGNTGFTASTSSVGRSVAPPGGTVNRARPQFWPGETLNCAGRSVALGGGSRLRPLGDRVEAVAGQDVEHAVLGEGRGVHGVAHLHLR